MKYLFWFFCFVLLLNTAGCNKSQRDLDTETASAHSFALAQEYLYDGFEQAHKVLCIESAFIDSSTLQIFPIETCIKSITSNASGNNFPKEINMNFGSIENSCSDSRTRKGNLKIKIWGPYLKKNTTMRIQFENYAVNGFEITGTDSLINNGKNANGALQFFSRMSDVELRNDSFLVVYTGQQTFTWIAGIQTESYANDIFEITGQSKGLAFTGATFSAHIANPLKRSNLCRNIESGTIEFKPQNLNLRLINYANIPTCDDSLRVTIAGRTYSLLID